MQPTLKNILLCLGLLSLCFVAIPVRVNGTDSVEQEFWKFIVLHKKPYMMNSTEYEERLQNFRLSRSRSLQYNKLHGKNSTMIFGITKFSDMKPEEFREILLRHQPSAEPCLHKPFLKGKTKQATKTLRKREIPLPNDKLPDYVDWRERQAITSVKNQLNCGACWAFSTVATVESMYAIRTKYLKEISVQQVIDCAKNGNLGCIGGDTCSALKWMTTNNVSLVDDSAYPLTLKNQQCRHVNSPGIRVAPDFTCYNLHDDEETLMRILAFHGPITAAVDAITWQDYLGGVIQYHCLDHINHAVQVVGYDRRGRVPYYIVKNSWGTDFGIDGYVHVAIGKNLCGIAREVSALDVVI